jgi:WD40 repeat-containing protein SMU1
MIEPGTDYDLFRGAPREAVVERVDKIVRKSLGKIKFGKSSFPQCSQFSRDGHMLITGTKDGFVEVWDYQKCKLRTDLEYQAKVRKKDYNEHQLKSYVWLIGRVYDA